MSELDKYIRQQIEQTQFEVDPDHLRDIENRLQKRRRNPFFFWLFTGLVVFSIGGLLLFFIARDKEELVNNDEIAINKTVPSGSKEIIDVKLDKSYDVIEAQKDQNAETISIDESVQYNNERESTPNEGNIDLETNMAENSIETTTLTKQEIRENQTEEELVFDRSIAILSRIPGQETDEAQVNPISNSELRKSKDTDLVERPISLLKTVSFEVSNVNDSVIDIYDQIYFNQIKSFGGKEKPSDINYPKIAIGPALNLEYFPAFFTDNNDGQAPIGYFGGVKMRYLVGQKTYLEASGFYGERKGGFVYEKSAENDFAGLRSRKPRNSLQVNLLRYFRLDLDAIYEVGSHELIGGVGMKLIHGVKGDATYHVQGISNEIERIMITGQWLETDGLRSFLPDVHLGYGYQFDFGLNIRLEVRAHWPKHNFPTLNGDDRFLYVQEFNWIYPSLTMSYLFSK